MPDTGFNNPSATGDDYNQWTNPAEAYSLDGSFTDSAYFNYEQDYYNFSFGVPAGATINGIELHVIWTGEYDGFTAKIAFELSWDGGSSYTTSGKSELTTDIYPTLTNTTEGGSADTWGRTWSSSEFSDANFRLKIKDNNSDNYVWVDHLEIKVYYTAAVTTSTSSTSSSTSSTSTSSTSSSSSSSSSSTSSTSTTISPSSGGLAFGEESPTEGETASSWALWSDGAAGNPTIIGDADWGKLQLNFNAEGRSKVYDFGNDTSRIVTLTENRYGTGQGTANLEMRGQATIFTQDDDVLAWEAYSVPIAKTWRWIQIREINE